jgi:recombinational DNA repair protein RecR
MMFVVTIGKSLLKKNGGLKMDNYFLNQETIRNGGGNYFARVLEDAEDSLVHCKGCNRLIKDRGYCEECQSSRVEYLEDR